jgi:sugar phosphate isomerase/epimerase
MNRRNFIRNVSLSAAALSISDRVIPATLKEAGKRQKLFVGAHVWVYAASQRGYDVSPILSRIFSDMAYAGFDGVETMEHPLRSTDYTKQIKELIDQYRIKLLGTSYGADMWDKNKHNQILEDTDLILTNLASAGGRTFGVSVGRPSGRKKTEEELDNQAALLKGLIDLSNKKNIILNLHNHTYEVENNMYDLRGTLKRLPDVKLGPDLNWLLRGGVDPVKFLKEFRNQIIFVHLRDQMNNGKWPESLGEGDVNFREISVVMDEIGFNGDVVIELAHENGFATTRPLRESLKISRDYLKNTMNI